MKTEYRILKIKTYIKHVKNNTDMKNIETQTGQSENRHKSTKNMVSEAVDPIKDRIFEINARLEKVESNPNQNTSNTEAQSKLQPNYSNKWLI